MSNVFEITSGGMVPVVPEVGLIGRKARQANNGALVMIVDSNSYGLICVDLENFSSYNSQSTAARSPFARISLVATDDSVAGVAEINEIKAKAVEAKNQAYNARVAKMDARKKSVDEKVAALRAAATIKISVDKRGNPAAGKNCKAMLVEAFPLVKFSVKSDSNSIGVYYPRSLSADDVKKVKAIASLFEAGSFDGMTDCYNYSKDEDVAAFGAVYGDVRYAFTYSMGE